MSSKSPRWGLLVVFFVAGGFAAQTQAQNVMPAQMFADGPRMAGVPCTVPAAQDQTQCRVDVSTTPQGQSICKLVDRQGQILRRFTSKQGSTRPYIWQYYKMAWKSIAKSTVGERDDPTSSAGSTMEA